MKHEVVLHPKVPSEVRQILAEYERVSKSLADEFWAELHEAFEFTRKIPLFHHSDLCGKRRCNLEKFPYHFLYRVIDSKVRVTIVRHHSRNPKLGTLRR